MPLLGDLLTAFSKTPELAVGVQDSITGQTALHAACSLGNLRAMKILLSGRDVIEQVSLFSIRVLINNPLRDYS